MHNRWTEKLRRNFEKMSRIYRRRFWNRTTSLQTDASFFFLLSALFFFIVRLNTLSWPKWTWAVFKASGGMKDCTYFDTLFGKDSTIPWALIQQLCSLQWSIHCVRQMLWWANLLFYGLLSGTDEDQEWFKFHVVPLHMVVLVRSWTNLRLYLHKELLLIRRFSKRNSTAGSVSIDESWSLMANTSRICLVTLKKSLKTPFYIYLMKYILYTYLMKYILWSNVFELSIKYL